MPYANQTHFIVATADHETRVYAVINHKMMLIKNVSMAASVSPSEGEHLIDFHLKPYHPGFTFKVLPNSERTKYYSI